LNYETVSLLALLLALGGCGYNPDDSAYDTAKNPDQFPPAALSLVDRLQSGELNRMNAISEAFGDLYTNHSNLLDNGKWLSVVERLGAKFGYRAGQLRDSGVQCYSQAAEYYQLAAFACPNDVRLQHQAGLFGTWLAAVERGFIDSASLRSGTPPLNSVLSTSRYFVLADSLHREFFEANLLRPWQDNLKSAGQLTPSVVGRLSAIDRTFMAYAGFNIDLPTEKAAVFLAPKIDLVAVQVRRLGADAYTIEAYFLPHEPVLTDVTIALRLVAAGADSLRPEFNKDSRFSQIDILPLMPSSTWKPDRLAAVAAGIGYNTTLKSVSLGLFERHPGGLEFLGIDGRADQFLPLDSSELLLQ
jgi:hypothetical protein